MIHKPRAVLVANVLTHYRLPLYEELQKLLDLRVIFYSDGNEWYWQRTEQPTGETLRDALWLNGFWVGRTRLTPRLIWELLRSDADVFIKDPNGKFALPVTYLLARLRRKPFVFWASLWAHPAGGLHRLTRPLMRHIYRNADWIVTYGRHVSRFVIEEGADPKRVSESPQAVAPAPGAVPSPGRWRTPVQLLYVGRLEEWKGVDVLLKALARLPSVGAWRLAIAGSGSRRNEFEALAHRLGIASSVRFLGKVPNRDLHAFYCQAAAVIIPSVHTAEFNEPWSLVVNEAMNAGALVVASDAVGAVADGLVSSGETGYVFSSNDVTSLASTLEAVLEAPIDRLVSLATAGQERVQNYSHSRAAQAFADAVASVLAHGRRG